MRSDYDIQRVYNEKGPNALTASERSRRNELDSKEFSNLVEGGIGLGSIIGTIFGIAFALMLLPLIITWCTAFFGLLAWGFTFCFFFRAGPAAFAILCSAAILVGMGDVPIFNLWLFDFTASRTGDPTIDAPLTWILGVLMISAVALPFGIEAFRNRKEVDDFADFHRMRRRLWKPVSERKHWFALPLIASPLVALTPLILWLGFYGEHGLASSPLTSSQALSLLARDPVEVVSRGLGSDLVWPASFWGKVLRVVLFVVIAPSIYVAASDWLKRLRVIKQERA